MSYVVAIWEQPTGLPGPGDIRAASKLVQMLYRVKPGPNPKFGELVQRLTARYPDITSPQAKDLPEDQLAWTDGPLSGDTDCAVYNLGLGPGMLEQVRPFVIETVRELGLNLFDDQAGDAHFADGTSIDLHGSRDTGFEREVFQGLASFMQVHGFEARAEELEFFRKFDQGWQRWTIDMVETWPPRYEFALRGGHDQFVIDKAYWEISGNQSPWAPTYHAPMGILHQDRLFKGLAAPYVSPRGYFTVRDAAELAVALPSIQQQIEKRLLPVLRRCETVTGYDEVMNAARVRDSLFFLADFFHGYERGSRNVLAAWFAGNPRLETICEDVLAGLGDEPAWSSAFENTRQCIKHVRQHRPPTTTPGTSR